MLPINQQLDLSSFRLAYPQIHPGIVYKNKGVHAIDSIPPKTLIMSCPSESVIRAQTVPDFIKKAPKLDDHDRIVLYILILKNGKGKWKESFSQPLRKWIQGKTMGFVSFSNRLIKESEDEQLQIEYAAYVTHYRQQATIIYGNQAVKSLILAHTSIQNQQQFTLKWAQASEFKNTRSFGHTNEHLIIPAMDYFNYDPARDCQKIVFVTFDSQEELIQLTFDEKETEFEEDSDEELEIFETTKKHVGMMSLGIIQAGDQLFFDYGTLSNYKLLKNYGYSVKCNPHDYVAIYLSNYLRQKMLYFSPVERSTTKHKLYPHKLNSNFVSQWKSLHKQSSEQSVSLLIACIEKTGPPKMNQKLYSELKQEQGFVYLILYQQEQEKIYKKWIERLKAFEEGQNELQKP